MPKKDVYRYWALFDHSDGNSVTVRFPDLPGCETFGDTAEEAHTSAREALEGFMLELETDGDAIPEPSSLDAIIAQADPNEAAADVQVYMPLVRGAAAYKSVKKTVTLPKWLNDEAENQRLNFSQVLQEALKQSLSINK